MEAKAFTEKWLSSLPVTLEVCKRDSFGRVLARVYRGESHLDDELIKRELGKVYP